MHSGRLLKLITISTLWSLALVTCLPTKASEIEDGKNYRAEEAVGFGGATMIFQKQGKEVVGIAYTGFWHACYHGSLNGSSIKVAEAVLKHEDPQTNQLYYGPLLESLHDRFVEINFVNAKPFPNPGALIPTPKATVERSLLSLNNCAAHWGAHGDRSSLADELQNCESRYYIAFIARKGVIGHAFVQWIEVDAQQKLTRSEAFGLYPSESSNEAKIVLGPVTGALKNEYLQTDGISGDAVLRIEVTAEEFSATTLLRDQWVRESSVGELEYRLLGQNCIDFTVAILRALHNLRPTIDLPPKATPTEFYDLPGAPYKYMEDIYELNRAHDVPITALGASCP